MPMTLSIRNQLPGTVAGVTPGEAMATVKIRLGGGQDLTAAITLESVADLALAQGTPVRALVKSPEAPPAPAPAKTFSIRNQPPGTVPAVAPGAAMATVRIAVE